MIWYLLIIGLLVLLVTPFFAYRQAEEINRELLQQLNALEKRYVEFIAQRVRQEKLRALGTLQVDAASLQEAAHRFLSADLAKFLATVRKRPYAGLSFSQSQAIFNQFRKTLEQSCQLAQRRRISFPEYALQEALQEDIEQDLLDRLLNTAS